MWLFQDSFNPFRRQKTRVGVNDHKAFSWHDTGTSIFRRRSGLWHCLAKSRQPGARRNVNTLQLENHPMMFFHRQGSARG